MWTSHPQVPPVSPSHSLRSPHALTAAPKQGKTKLRQSGTGNSSCRGDTARNVFSAFLNGGTHHQMCKSITLKGKGFLSIEFYRPTACSGALHGPPYFLVVMVLEQTPKGFCCCCSVFLLQAGAGELMLPGQPSADTTEVRGLIPQPSHLAVGKTLRLVLHPSGVPTRLLRAETYSLA